MTRRWPRMTAVLLAAALLVGTVIPASAAPLVAPEPATPAMTDAVTTDVVVYGGTPSGIVAAVSAARAGARVVLLEPTDRIGGMMTSGLSWTDRGDTGAIGGVAREVFNRIQAIEGSAYGRYAFQPKTALQVFATMLAEAGVQVRHGQRLAEASDAVTRAGGRIATIRTEIGDTFTASVFVDAGYEGDLMARAGVAYRVGRESTAEYGETLAGVRPASFAVQVAPGTDLGFPVAAPGPLGSADDRIQASNYRLCLTTDPANRVTFTAPAGYDSDEYEVVLEYIQRRMNLGQTPTREWVLHMDRLVAGKWDLNENGPITLGLPGANYGYPDGTYAERDAIRAVHRDYQQGFLYFLTTDPRIPLKIRLELAQYGLCADEFTDTANWPPLLYLREGRRMVGRHVLSQHDVTALISKPDTIGLASYPLDSHAVSRWIDGANRIYIEGGLGAPRVQRWSIPYRSITPEREQVENLLVPVTASATHVAYASLRMEPQYMIMGQAAGTAAAIAWTRRLPVQSVAVGELRSRLLSAGVVLTDPGDIASTFYTEIEWAYYEGIVTGCAPGRFCPNEPLRRDEMATILDRALDLPSASRDYFTDDTGNPHEASINAVAQAGITFGCGGGRYCPAKIVSREEMASFLVRAFRLPPSSTDHFTDDETSIHEADINALATAGITGGCSPTAFCPKASVTRGQILAFLYRFFGGGPSGPVTAGSSDSTSGARPRDVQPSATEVGPSPSPTPAGSPAPSSTPMPTPTPSVAPSDEPAPTPDASPSPSPSPTVDPTPPPDPTPTPTPPSTAAPPAGPDPP